MAPSEIRKAVAWRLLGEVRGYPGFVHGARYPALVFRLQGCVLSPAARDALSACFLASCPTWRQAAELSALAWDWPKSVQWLLSAWKDLQVALGLPVFDTGRMLASTDSLASCVVPTQRSAQRALAGVIQQTIAFLSPAPGVTDELKSKRLRQSISLLATLGVKAANVPRFVKAALELGYPIHELPGGTYQYGVAQRARWMNSSFTDVTPAISSALARNKVSTATLLRQAGIPVPSHLQVDGADTAVRVAQQMGFPVVVKPADCDGGLGVAAGLETDDEVRHAFAAASQHSSRVLVEKHVEGRDYRLTIFNGEVIWAIERVPGGVVGDGHRSVSELVGALNADPRRGSGIHSPLKAVVWDEEAEHLLKRQGLDKQSVPTEGRWVRLRRAANVASGGTPVAVFDQVHPDNARLAVRAAKALCLDLAGIDLLIPDVSVSWRETGAAICEVNAQPSLGQTTAAHLYALILRRLVSGSGRVPTVMVLGAADPDAWLNGFSKAFSDRGFQVGLVGPKGVVVGEETLSVGAVSPYAGGRMLALNREVSAMVVAINDGGLMQTGLPLERFNGLVLAGTQLRSGQAGEGLAPRRLIGDMLGNLLPACDGVVLTHKDGGLNADALAKQTTAQWHSLDGSVLEAVNETVQRVLACVAERDAHARRDSAGSFPTAI
jgi:cyanophycin synthetase